MIHAQKAMGPCPIHEVVPSAVTNAVTAATTTFTAMSTIRFHFITHHSLVHGAA